MPATIIDPSGLTETEQAELLAAVAQLESEATPRGHAVEPGAR